MEQKQILCVDDSHVICRMLTNVLERNGYASQVAYDKQTAMARLNQFPIDLVLLDLHVPLESDGLELLKWTLREKPYVSVIMMSANVSVKSAIEAVKMGAFHFLEKPLDNDLLLLTIEKALSKKYLEYELLRTKSHLVGESQSMKNVYERIIKFASSDANILITGETGTGKELVARAVHILGKRAQRNFVAFNCAAIPVSLFESEMFGHAKGSFTGAISDHVGFFEQANNGTLLMDEIEELSNEQQAKLLRVLQDKQFRRVGSTKVTQFDVRILAASNKNLMQMVSENSFRQDLFQRLNILNIELPPLRNRKEDIPILTEFFLGKIANERKIEIKSITPVLLNRLMEYDWPGNVRELENSLLRACELSPGNYLREEDFDIFTKDNAVLDMSLKAAMKRFEREYIMQQLAIHQYGIQQTAAILGIDRTNLFRKMKSLNIATKHRKRD
jgi:DNA-binding NtrC family response regulator